MRLASRHPSMSQSAASLSLPNLGPGPDPFSFDALAADVAFAVLYLQRDHFCTNCRGQVQTVADRIDEFRERDAEVVSIVPESRERVAEWRDEYDLPFPILADPNAAAGDAYDQPVRFGFLGRFSDFLGRMPVVVVVELRGPEPTVAWTYAGSSTFDRPDVDDVLAVIDDLREDDGAD